MSDNEHRPNSESENRLRVLLIAYGCEPDQGSEPGTGWNMALALAEYHDVTVVTRANNRPVIEGFFGNSPASGLGFIYVDPPAWALRLKKCRILGIQAFYALWQWSVARALKQNPSGLYDVIHQLTFNSFEVPPIAFLTSTAINVWGPTGGGQTVPFRMLPAFGTVGGFKEFLRNIRVHISARNPLFRAVLRRSSLVLFANRETRKLISGSDGDCRDFMIDVGVNVDDFAPALAEPNQTKVKILFAGRFEHRKGALLLLKAFERVAKKHSNVELRLVGDGPLRRRLIAYAKKMKLGDQVVFPGLVSHAGMRSEMAGASIFAFPSLRDTSGAVVLEAMATCLPVVCFDHQGAAIMVADGCGLRVPAKAVEIAVNGLADAICTLVENPGLASRMGTAAREHVNKNHHWKAKASRMDQHYRSLITTAANTLPA